MSCLSVCLAYFCKSSRASDSNPLTANSWLRVPNGIWWKALQYLDAEPYAFERVCKRFREITRNKELQNNKLWFEAMQIRTPIELIFKGEFNYKNFYLLFIVNHFPVKRANAFGDEFTSHKKAIRCDKHFCVSRERLLFKEILNAETENRDQLRRTIFLIARIFPLRALWDEDKGSELRFCIDCKENVLPNHGQKSNKPNNVFCVPADTDSYDFPRMGSLI